MSERSARQGSPAVLAACPLRLLRPRARAHERRPAGGRGRWWRLSPATSIAFGGIRAVRQRARACVGCQPIASESSPRRAARTEHRGIGRHHQGARGRSVRSRLSDDWTDRSRRHPSSIVEELLRIAAPSWRRSVEVPVFRPARGFIDVVFDEPTQAVAVATEIQSRIDRLEQQIRWAQDKARSLPSSDMWRFIDQERSISRLLVLRSTSATREIARRFHATLAAAYPAKAADIHVALTSAGIAMAWARDPLGRRSRRSCPGPRSTPSWRLARPVMARRHRIRAICYLV